MKALIGSVIFYNLVVIAIFAHPEWPIFLMGIVFANLIGFCEWHALKHEKTAKERTLISSEKIKTTAKYKKGI